LNGDGVRIYSEVKKEFGGLSSLEDRGGGAFDLHPASKRFLGVEKQEKDHVEALVMAEVEARVSGIREAAYQEGLESGRQEGARGAVDEYRSQVEPLLQQFRQLIEGFDGIKKDLYASNESVLIQLMFQIGKQVLLKDLAADRDYVKRLMLHVIEKVGAKESIRIRISRKDAENLESIKDFLKTEIPDLKNVHIEASDDLPLGGCRVETDLSRINAGVESQLAAIEKSLAEA
jgi:flagellar assembly protein FliH